jgi:hypothetical protein
LTSASTSGWSYKQILAPQKFGKEFVNRSKQCGYSIALSAEGTIGAAERCHWRLIVAQASKTAEEFQEC